MAQWPASNVEMRSVSSLSKYARNPRVHSDDQVKRIAASIQEYGWTVPVLVDESGELIAGHGRIMAAETIGIESVPVMVARGWTSAQKKAYRIADNQLTISSDWSAELLKSELAELKVEQFDLGLTGFSDKELFEILSDIGDVGAQDKKRRELTNEETERLHRAWKRVLKDWAEVFATADQRPWLTPTFTKGALAVHFVKAQLWRDIIPRNATLPYVPHRAFIGGYMDENRTLPALVHKEQYISNIRFATMESPKFDDLLMGLAIQGHRIPQEFPSDLARSLIDEFCVSSGWVLDPCHGWGGRMLGFLLSGASAYTAFDVDPLTSRGVQLIFDDLVEFCLAPKRTDLQLMPFENSDLPADQFDFAMTSPPYFNVERYGGEQSSWRLYGDFDAWVAGFYRPMISKVFAALKPDCVFALQIGSQMYPLRKVGVEIANKIGFKLVEVRPTEMINTNEPNTQEGDGEVVVVLRKPR